jgi:hypothetical protein
MDEPRIDLSEAPEVREEQMRHALLRLGGKPIGRHLGCEAICYLSDDEFFLIGSDPGHSGLGTGSIDHDKNLYSKEQEKPCAPSS